MRLQTWSEVDCTLSGCAPLGLGVLQAPELVGVDEAEDLGPERGDGVTLQNDLRLAAGVHPFLGPKVWPVAQATISSGQARTSSAIIMA
jgi:hypothetical protein